jgi:hypothetical protein
MAFLGMLLDETLEIRSEKKWANLGQIYYKFEKTIVSGLPTYSVVNKIPK